jgi:broad specificity phosphatase PhoE
MRPKRIILIRHGESEGNVDENVYSNKPDYKLDLTSKGLEQAEKCGINLRKITKNESCFFYVSPLFRTRQTYKQIVKSYTKELYETQEEPRVREQEWGHLKDVQTCDNINLARDEYGVFYYRIPDGESAADVYDRVSDFYGTLHRDFEKENFRDNCIVVTHGMTIRLFLMKWFHWTVEEFENLKNPENCDVIVLEKGADDKYKLLTEMKKNNKNLKHFEY